MTTRIGRAIALTCVLGTALTAAARPAPRPAAQARLDADVEIIGIVHWGLNTYTDREWGFGDEKPADLNPDRFDADQIVGACKAGGLKGLVIVAKHHDGFCLWPTKTTEHNISKSPFRGGKGDYVREMEQACRKAGLKFGVYVSPWDRNSVHYATEKYVELYHAQIKELLSGGYGEVFEMWFDGANGGDGWYGGVAGPKGEKRKIKSGYYRFPEVFRFVRELQPNVCIFAGESDASDYRWPGNERGILDPDSRATIETVGGFSTHGAGYGNPNYKGMINTGAAHGDYFRMCEADFPLRPGWFYHAGDKGKTKSAAYLTKLYLSSVGNGGTMNIGIAPNKSGLLDDEDVRALKGFGILRKALFSKPVTEAGVPFNVVLLRENLSHGEQVDGWEVRADGRTILSGKSIGNKRIRLLPQVCTAKKVEVVVTKDGGEVQSVTLLRYLADPALVETVTLATTESGETDTAKWMTSPRR